MTYQFEWRNDEGNNALMHASFTHPMDAWLAALGRCGWDNRTTLRTTNQRGDTILNWWDVSSHLPLLGTKANYESDKAFHMKSDFWKNK